MDSTTRFIAGLILVLAIDIFLIGTAVFLIRRRKRIEPAWSWAKTLGAVFLLTMAVTAVGLVPAIGRLVGLILSLIGLKRISGLDLLSTFILSFFVGVLVFIVAGVICNQMRVDLLSLEHRGR